MEIHEVEESLETEHEDIHKVEESLKTEHVEIPPADEFLSESLENHEEEDLELIKHDHESLIEDNEVQSHHVVVCPLPSTDVISIVHTRPTPILLSHMFVKVSHVSVSKDDKHMRVKNKRVKRVMKRERKMSGKKMVISILRRKKRKKIRNGKRVRKKKCLFLMFYRLPWLGFEGKSF